MTFSSILRAFWEARESLAPSVHRYAWGVVATDDRYPSLPSATQATVFGWAPNLDVASIRLPLLRAAQQAGARYEHVVLLSSTDPGTGLDRQWNAMHSTRSVVLQFAGPIRVPTRAGLDLVEVSAVDTDMVAFLGKAHRMLGASCDDEADQLVRRDIEVFIPAGLRWFAAIVEGTIAGFSSLHSLGGVGFIGEVAVLPSFRAMGIGPAVFCMALEASHASGNSLVHGFVRENARAMHLYRSLGCLPHGVCVSLIRPLPSVTLWPRNKASAVRSTASS